MENRRRALTPRPRRAAALALALAVALAAATAHGATADEPLALDSALRRAAMARLHGEDERAVELLQPLVPAKGALKPAEAAAAAALGEALWRQGRAAEARKTLHACMPAAACARVLGRFELDEGDRARALAALTRAVAARGRGAPQDLALQVLLGEALYAVGQDVAARKLLDPIADLYQDGQVSGTGDLCAVARSLALNGFYKDANEVMAEAVEAAADDSERKQAEAAWSQLFLSKYNFHDADIALRKVLAFDGRDADALLAMARIDLDSDHDIAGARKRLDGLLDRTPDAVRALCLRAEVALHDEEIGKARALVERAAALAPKHRDVLALRVTLALLADDAKAAKAAQAQAQAVDPGDARPLVVAAHYLELGHRYREVVAVLQQAIVVDPEDGRAHAALGLGLSRMADDAGARKHLQVASRLDPFHVRTANVLSVLYEGVLRHMELLRGRAVDLRVHRSERRAFERTVLPFLQESHDDLAQRYGFAPQRPLQVEVFPTTEQFSVRTVGLPRLGAHAVCFGHLITSRSPSEEPFNWKLVLHHELSHVFHIQATSGRVPRWLTEGLAMRESERLDARYHMIFERQLYDRLLEGKLATIAKFNLAFTQAKSGEDIMLAYYQAFFLVRFLEQRHGFDKLRELVVAHKADTPTPALVQAVYGASAEALDAAFADWLRRELGRFDADYRPTVAAIDAALQGAWQAEAGAGAKALRAFRAAARLGDGAAAAGALRRFEAADAAALAIEGDDTASAPLLRAGPGCAALFLALLEAAARGDYAAASRRAEALVAVPGGRCDGVRQRLTWAQALVGVGGEGAAAAASVQLARAAALDPRDASVVRAQLALGKATLTVAERARLLARGLQLEPNALDHGVALAALAHEALQPVPAGDVPASPTTGNTTGAAASASASWPRADALVALRAAAKAIEETAPASAVAVLTEARLLAHEGKAKAAVPVYELALERTQGDAARRALGCEAAALAKVAGAKELAEDAGRICAGVAARREGEDGGTAGGAERGDE